MALGDNVGVTLVKQVPGQVCHWSDLFWPIGIGPHLPIYLRQHKTAAKQTQTGSKEFKGKINNGLSSPMHLLH